MALAQEIYNHGLHPSVEGLNFDRIKWKLCESGEAKMTKEECDLAEQEYRRYLTLKKLYPGVELVPNKLLDEFWHAHILDTVAYHADCDAVFGFYLHHFPYFGIYGEEDYQNLVSAFDKTKELYELHFGEYPERLDNAARCEDHPCHVPSECACRAPGTCK
ncbi:hypothetical protein BWR19_12955 [Halomonas sp. 1513]|nr:hypothetical protein [Halomonas sp. 1513]APX93774.1 hypothetical protein BWR19_12955 [Halomonas sp. 1513]